MDREKPVYDWVFFGSRLNEFIFFLIKVAIFLLKKKKTTPISAVRIVHSAPNKLGITTTSHGSYKITDDAEKSPVSHIVLAHS